MKTRLSALLVSLVLLVSLPAAAQNYPDHFEKYVNDYGTVLEPKQEDEIRDWLKTLDRSGIEMTVLTIDTMKDYGHRGEIEPFATGLFNTWGIGDAAKNNGVLILVSRVDRQMRIELGAGYAKSFDAKMQGVIDTQMLPSFRDGDYAEGIRNGVGYTIREVTGAFPTGFPELPQGPWDKFLRLMKNLAIAAVMVAILLFGRSGSGSSSGHSGNSFGGGRSSGGGASGRW